MIDVRCKKSVALKCFTSYRYRRKKRTDEEKDLRWSFGKMALVNVMPHVEVRKLEE